MNYVTLVRQYGRFIGYGGLHYFFSGFGQTFLISLFVPYFCEALDINNFTYGSIYSAATLTSGLLIPFLGGIIDRTKIRYASVLNALLLSGFCVLTSFANNYWLLFAGLFGLRFCGQGLMVLIGSTAISRFFQEHRGKALSLSTLGMPLSEAILPVCL